MMCLFFLSFSFAAYFIAVFQICRQQKNMASEMEDYNYASVFL